MEEAEALGVGQVQVCQSNTHVDLVHGAKHFVPQESLFIAVGVDRISVVDDQG